MAWFTKCSAWLPLTFCWQRSIFIQNCDRPTNWLAKRHSYRDAKMQISSGLSNSLYGLALLLLGEKHWLSLFFTKASNAWTDGWAGQWIHIWMDELTLYRDTRRASGRAKRPSNAHPTSPRPIWTSLRSAVAKWGQELSQFSTYCFDIL